MYLTTLHLLFELSTPFLHIRWFLIKTNRANNMFAHLNDYCFVLFFFIARVVMGPIYFYWYISVVHLDIESKIHYVFIPSMVISNALNYFWFVSILKSAMVASPSKKRKQNEKYQNKKKTK